ncbi:hypothetical protein GCM10010170_092700 [Dactylosporangium salmoneum]|uniref:Uncharacterized protein n=1 Tax=Dactylosporangium salmoneum TaxID=53361 RepID=A0ABN3HM69_9ACTN
MPYTDRVIYPDRVVVDWSASGDREFPDWPSPVLLISVENQGVCAWGVPLAGQNPPVLVGGQIVSRTGWSHGTTQYCPDVAAFVASRRWDAACLSQEPLIQAQAAELDAGSLEYLRERYEQGPVTVGWPGHTVHRFQCRDAKIMLWDSPGQCDWWISAVGASALDETIAAVWHLSDLRTSLWSSDSQGAALLRRLRGH